MASSHIASYSATTTQSSAFTTRSRSVRCRDQARQFPSKKASGSLTIACLVFPATSCGEGRPCGVEAIGPLSLRWIPQRASFLAHIPLGVSSPAASGAVHGDGCRGEAESRPDRRFMPQLQAAEELGICRYDDGRGAHRDRPDAHRQVDAPRDEHPGGDRDREQVVGGRPGQVLDHLPIGGARQPDCADEVAKLMTALAPGAELVRAIVAAGSRPRPSRN